LRRSADSGKGVFDNGVIRAWVAAPACQTAAAFAMIGG
jgi:hypothetical protein